MNDSSSTPHPAFEHQRSHPIPALRLEAHEFRHRATGARHIHLAAADSHNAFLVAFLTAPQDSTGVAHILEHTALCGSRRFPVRDPFFLMTRRSLSTFMNAFTSSDWTAYPFASQNQKDFNNLLDVYLDAVFFPNLDPLDFAQEGHRVEFADPQDPASELVFKGVVFNEMKGAMSSPVQRLAQALQSQLFPTTTYHYNSGGDPRAIPGLTWEQLKDFHATHYHPANAVFMTYGDIPAAAHQERFEALALGQFQALPVNVGIADERRYPEPLTAAARYPVEGEHELADNTHIVLGWLLGKNTDPREVLQTRILADVLLDNSSSPLRQALETTPQGTAPSPLCGFDHATRETTFICGLEGSNPEQAEAVEALILDVLRQVAEQGVPQSVLDAVLHQLELSQREITGDGFPYGLHLMLEALTPAIHGGDPVAALDLDPLLEELRQEIRQPGFITTLVRRWLLDNPHRVRLVMAPDAGLSAQEAAAERQRLAALQAAMSAADRQRIQAQAQALQARQQQADNAEQLPRVELADIPAELPIAEGQVRPLPHLPATWFAQGTNGMVYQQLVLELPAVDEDLLDILPLFVTCLTEVGSGGRDYLATQALQAAVTGGLSARCLVGGGVDDVYQTQGVLALAGKALARHHEELTKLLAATLTSARFDERLRLRELIAQLRAEREEAITDHGHLLAIAAASARLTPAAALSQRWEGLDGLLRLKALDEELDQEDRLADFAHRLAQLHEQINAAPRQLLLVSEKERQEELAAALLDCWQIHPHPKPAPERFTLPPVTGIVRQGWSVNTQVNFCARVYPTVAQNHPDAPALQVLGNFLRNGYLHRAVREQGGAYGAGARYHADSGGFQLFSYRDPRLQETLADFDRALDWLQTEKHPQRALEEAILGVIAAIDRPGSPAGEAISAFFNSLFGRTPEQRRAYRRQILQVTIADLQRVAAAYLRPEQASSAVLSDAATLATLPDWERLAV